MGGGECAAGRTAGDGPLEFFDHSHLSAAAKPPDVPMPAHPVLRTAAAVLASLASLALGGCSTWFDRSEPMFGWISPYRIDVQQGNVVTSEQLAEVKVGMSRLQVRNVLGTPLLVDNFHPDRWDYLFLLDRPGRLPQRRDVILHFNGDRLEKIDASELPSERDFVASVARTGLPEIAMRLALTEEQIKALPKPGKPSTSPATPVEPPSTSTRLYPPLDPS
jgi:outer membrane protein assembly factor BamE